MKTTQLPAGSLLAHVDSRLKRGVRVVYYQQGRENHQRAKLKAGLILRVFGELFGGVVRGPEHHYVAGGKGEAPYLTRKDLKAWVDTEFEIFKTFASYMFDKLLEYSEGNPPAQGQHDCATLENHKK